MYLSFHHVANTILSGDALFENVYVVVGVHVVAYLCAGA